MSREVDASDLTSLSEEDLKYLHDRSVITTEQMAEALQVSKSELADALRELTQQGIPLEERANTGTANTANLTPDEYLAKVSNSDSSEDEDVDEEETYEEMSNDALRAELASRGLEVSGKKAELIERLEQDDAEAEETE